MELLPITCLFSTQQFQPTSLRVGDAKEGGAGAPQSAHIPQGRKGCDYLLAEDHLVVKQEEDPLLVAAIGLVDPGHLPGVDQLRAPV